MYWYRGKFLLWQRIKVNIIRYKDITILYLMSNILSDNYIIGHHKAQNIHINKASSAQRNTLDCIILLFIVLST